MGTIQQPALLKDCLIVLQKTILNFYWPSKQHKVVLKYGCQKKNLK